MREGSSSGESTQALNYTNGPKSQGAWGRQLKGNLLCLLGLLGCLFWADEDSRAQHTWPQAPQDSLFHYKVRERTA